MSKTDYQYDPNFPYVTRSGVTGYVSGRFPTRENAEKWTDGDEWVVIIDTTPKPKIPEDAEFVLVTWPNEDAFTRRMGNSWYWYATEETVTHQELIDYYLDNGEVTVLVRKEES